VAVRFGGGEQLLHPGATWPLCPSEDSAVAPSAPVRTSKATGAVRASLRGTRVAVHGAGANDALASPSLGGPPPASGSLSTLADQNDLLAAALAARQRGDVSEALQWLDRLLTRYPGGQLAGSARAERRRLLDGGASARERDPK
jgi:hypothetical protein